MFAIPLEIHMRRKYRTSAIVLVVLGALLLTAAAITRFVVVPAVTKLPKNLDVTSDFTGTASMLNAKALTTNDLTHMYLRDLPITVVRHTYVSSADASTAVIHDDSVLKTPDGTQIPTRRTFALDRTTLQDAPPPPGVNADPHTGLTVSFPLHPKPDDTAKFWDSTTQRVMSVHYTGASTLAGRAVYNYIASAQGPLKETSTLAALPSELPKPVLAAMLPTLPDTVRSTVTAGLDTLPDAIGLSYTSTTSYEVAADRTLGVPLRLTQHYQFVSDIEIQGKPLALMPVLDVTITSTDKTIKNAAHNATRTARILTVVSLVIPITALILGLSLATIGVLRRQKPNQDRPRPTRRTSA
ncbi:porin PorA family protein [Nocardia sp. CA-129566]|uniref:porin PorA family protein n=1 Tax=Nocardia sp. CA-129566 TaxID=3239976 RepID=UPI003D9969CA